MRLDSSERMMARLPQSRPAPAGSARRGAALILALVILTALMLLGLPFAISQNRSVDGAFAFRAAQTAERGAESAERLGLGAAAEAVGRVEGGSVTGAWVAGVDHSQLGRDLRAALDPDPSTDPDPVFWTAERPALIAVRMRNVGRATLADTAIYNRHDSEEDPADRIDLRQALTIEDHGGRIDVNALTRHTWHELLQEVGIRDWDDGSGGSGAPDPADSHDPIQDVAADLGGDGDLDEDGGGTDFNDDNDDGDPYGELAEALAGLRFHLGSAPDWRLDELSQLLQADPEHNTQDPSDPARYQYGTTDGAVPASESFGFRRPLTRAELERLRPHLTTFGTGQGRRGLQDLGTVISVAGATPILDSDPSELLDRGSVLLTGDAANAPANGIWQTPNDNWLNVTSTHLSAPLGSHAAGHHPGSDLVAGDLVFLEQVSPINVNVAGPVSLRIASGREDIPGTLTPPFSHYRDDPSSLGLGLSLGLGSSFANLRYRDLLDPVASGRLRPPVAMRSFGIVGIEAAATALDAGDRPVATRRRQVIAQALPQRDDPSVGEWWLTRIWNHQGHFEETRLARNTSQAVSHPVPLGPRALTTSDPSDDPLASHLAGATQPNLSTVVFPPVVREWSRPLRDVPGGANITDATSILTEGADSAAPTSGAAAAADLHPDGLDVRAAIEYQVDLSAVTGPLRGVGPSNTELFGHHLSLWLRGAETGGAVPAWMTSGRHTLFEVAADPGNLGDLLTGGSGSVEYQNLYRIDYDADNGYLVVVLANPAIEHLTDHLADMPFDDTADTSLAWDEASLGTGAGTTLALAPAHPEPLRRVEHYYKVEPALQAGQWHHLQVVVNHSRPGGIEILLDGFPGRDLMRDQGGISSVGTPRHGDQATLPSLVLATDLPTATAMDGDDLYIGSIELERSAIHADLGIAADACLAARGAVLIGDEVIAYSGITTIDPDTISIDNCVRGSGQNTITTGVEALPTLAAHRIGDLVLPYGPRLHDPGTLFTGQTTLAEDFQPAGASNDYRVTARLSRTGSDYSGDPGTWDAMTDVVTWDTDSSDGAINIPLENIQGTFPPTGIVQFGPMTYHYQSVSGTMLLSCTLRDLPFNSNPGSYSFTLSNSPEVTLISLQVADDPTAAGAFSADPAEYQNLLQISDPLTDRVEWISYNAPFTTTISSTAYHYFLNQSGFAGSLDRGRERTIFPPSYTPSPGSPSIATGSIILPVQTAAGGGTGRRHLHTGDVATLLPDAAALAAGQAPVQLAVRLAATDHYARAASIAANGGPIAASDTHNEAFAFTTRVPDTHATPDELIVGTGWSGQDLSPLNPIASSVSYHDAMPRLDASAAGWDPEMAAASWFPDSDLHNGDLRVDALLVGHLGSGAGVAGSTDLGQVTEIDGDIVDSVPAASSDPDYFGHVLTFDRAIFAGVTGISLLRLGGEIVAVERTDDSSGEIVARALFGTAADEHEVTIAANGAVRGPSVLRLPLGPVAALTGVVDPTLQGELPLASPPSGLFQAPALLLLDRDGADASGEAELCYVTDHSGAAYTAPWLRGIYGTSAGTFEADDLAIAWWPRFASPITAGDSDERRYRCRRYLWAGFPLRFREQEIRYAAASGTYSGPLSLEARFLDDRSFDWTAADVVVSGGSLTARPSDGGELRVFWRCTPAPGWDPSDPANAAAWFAGVAARGNVAARLEEAELSVVAPTIILGREGGR